MQIAQAELEVMNILWETPTIGAQEVYEALGDENNWNIRTVKTLLARLVEKGALKTTPEGRRYLYAPLISQKKYQRTATSQFIDKVFSGRAAPLVAHLADAGDLTEEDIEDLEKLLEKLSGREHKK
ncbi:MAG: BlaI/MecI/CopY family transcriptional regulator [Parvularculaceae bacterium]